MEHDARRTAASACAYIARGEDDLAQRVLQIYMLEQLGTSGSPMLAMSMLVSALMGVAVQCASGPGAFTDLAAHLTLTGGEW